MVKERERIIQKHMGLVRWIARRMKGRLSAVVEMEDLVQAGYLGLVEAVKQKDREKGFRTYVGMRIRGAMLDFLRREDWPGRDTREWWRRLKRVQLAYLGERGREPYVSEYASELGVGREKVEQWLRDAGSIHEVVRGKAVEAMQEAEAVYSRGMFLDLREALLGLSVRARWIIEEHVCRGRPQYDIAVEMGVTGGRMSQLYTQALAALQSHFEI